MERNAQDGKRDATWRSAAVGPCLSYVARDDATPEGELMALAAVYRFVLERHEAKRAAGADGGEEGAEHGTVTGSSQKHAQDH